MENIVNMEVIKMSVLLVCDCLAFVGLEFFIVPDLGLIYIKRSGIIYKLNYAVYLEN